MEILIGLGAFFLISAFSAVLFLVKASSLMSSDVRASYPFLFRVYALFSATEPLHGWIEVAHEAIFVRVREMFLKLVILILLSLAVFSMYLCFWLYSEILVLCK